MTARELIFKRECTGHFEHDSVRLTIRIDDTADLMEEYAQSKVEIKTEEDYDYILALVEVLMDAEPNTVRFQLLKFLSEQLEKYEKRTL